MPAPVVVIGDVLDAALPALVVPYDGKNRLFEGNVASAFMRRFPEQAYELAERIERADPVPFGEVRPYPVRAGAFEWVVMASTHGHLPDDVGIVNHLGSVVSATVGVVRWAVHKQLEGVATPLLRGGWRLRSVDAAYAMMDGFGRDSGRMPVHIFCLDEEDAALVRDALAGQGW
jgi:hypothetical protein